MPTTPSRALPDLSAFMATRSARRRGSTTEDVTAALREAILDGVIPPGTWLREQDLATALQVSRTPIREALPHLAEEQLVDRTTSRGAVVRTMGLDEILAVYVVRTSLEGLAARTAATHRPVQLVDRLLAVDAEMVETIEGPVSKLAALNLEFHRTIRESTGNPYLERFLRQVEHAVRRFGTTTYADPARAHQSMEEHREIIAAITDGDPARAEEAAIRHMSRARDARIATLVDHMGSAGRP